VILSNKILAILKKPSEQDGFFLYSLKSKDERVAKRNFFKIELKNSFYLRSIS